MLTAAVSRVGDERSTTAIVAYVALLALLRVTAVISLRTAGRNTRIASRLCAGEPRYERDTRASCDSDLITPHHSTESDSAEVEHA